MDRVYLAHHWLVTYRGGEQVLREFRMLFPNSPVATLVLKRGQIPDEIIGPSVITSWLQYVPFSDRYFRQLFPLHVTAIKMLRIPNDASILLSSDASMIKGVQLPKKCVHVCYCHSPPRYLWEMSSEYLGRSSSGGKLGRLVFQCAAPFAKRFDREAAQRVNFFISNSAFVAERIKRYYQRDSVVVYPPVDVGRFSCTRQERGFYLIVTKLVAYKRVDIAIDAFNKIGKRLLIVGDGPEMDSLRLLAGPTIKFLGRQADDVVKELLETCRCFINPQLEDFGITAVEAQAAGKPVIAYRGGGALETVVDNVTGIFFDRQNSVSLAEAVLLFEEKFKISSSACRKNAERFSAARFRTEMISVLETARPGLFSELV